MKLFKITLSAILFLFLFNPALFAQTNSPEDAVKEWMQVYGLELDKASELATLNFREGKPKKTWAELFQTTVKNLTKDAKLSISEAIRTSAIDAVIKEGAKLIEDGILAKTKDQFKEIREIQDDIKTKIIEIKEKEISKLQRIEELSEAVRTGDKNLVLESLNKNAENYRFNK